MRILLVLSILLFATIARADIKIEALGQGGAAGTDVEQTRRRALDDGLRQAVDQVISTLVDPAARKTHGEVIKSRVLKRARAYVVSHRILDEGVEAGVYQVHVEAMVADQALKRDLGALGVPLLGGSTGPTSQPQPAPVVRPGVGVMVVGTAPAGLADAAVAALGSRGLLARALPAVEGDEAILAAARSSNVSSVLVISAKASSDGRVRGTRLFGARIDLEARLLGSVSWSGSSTVGGAGIDDAGALAAAGKNAGVRVAALVAPALIAQEPARPVVSEGIVVRVRGVARWQEPGALVKALGGVPGVERVVADGASRGELRFRVIGRVAVDSLAAAVPGPLGAVAGRQADALEIELYPPALAGRAGDHAVRILALLLLVGCAHATATARRPTETAVVRVDCEPGDATIWIDGRLVAQVRDARGGVRVVAGTHRLEVRHDRFHTRYFELALARGEERVLDVQLAEELD